MVVIAGILGFILKTLLFLIVALLVLLLLILIIPFTYSFSAFLKEKTIIHMEAHWIVLHAELSLEDWSPHMKINVLGRTVKSGHVEKKIRKKSAEKERKKKFEMPDIEFFREAISFVKEVVEVIKPKVMTAQGFYGLDDPANTAAVSYLIMLVNSIAPNAQIRLNPLFDSEMKDMEVNISGRITLILLIFIMIKYLLKKEVRKVLFQKRTCTQNQNVNI
jgi:hypothetical protein